MSVEYLKYIPSLAADPTVNSIILTFIPGIFYVLAAYGHLFIANASLLTSIVISVLFATLEYIVRVPIIKYSSVEAGMSNTTMQVIWVIITILLSKVSDGFFPKAH